MGNFSSLGYSQSIADFSKKCSPQHLGIVQMALFPDKASRIFLAAHLEGAF
jgi:hypothetical protein